MFEVELAFRSSVKWINDAVSKYSADVSIRDIRKSHSGTTSLVEIFTPGENISEVFGGMRAGMELPESSTVVYGKGRGTVIMDTHDCPICNSVVSDDVFLVDSHSKPGNIISLTLIIPSDEILHSFLHRLEDRGLVYEIIKKRNLKKKTDLTERQEFVVRTALELGFFDYPKRIHLEGLSKRLNVSYVTLAEILRRAEKNILTDFFR